MRARRSRIATNLVTARLLVKHERLPRNLFLLMAECLRLRLGRWGNFTPLRLARFGVVYDPDAPCAAGCGAYCEQHVITTACYQEVAQAFPRSRSFCSVPCLRQYVKRRLDYIGPLTQIDLRSRYEARKKNCDQQESVLNPPSDLPEVGSEMPGTPGWGEELMRRVGDPDLFHISPVPPGSRDGPRFDTASSRSLVELRAHVNERRSE